MVEIMFKEFNSLPFLSLTDVVLKVFVMMQVGFKSNWTYIKDSEEWWHSHLQNIDGVWELSLCSCFGWHLKDTTTANRQKVEDICEFNPGSLPLRACVRAKSLQSCLTLCDPMDCSLPGSSVPGILQARILEWVSMPSSRASSWSRDWTCISYVSCIGRRLLHH